MSKSLTIRKSLRFALLATCLCATGIGCKKDSGPANPGGGSLTEPEKQAIVQTYQSISGTADSLLRRSDPVPAWRDLLPTYRAISNVEDAWVTDDGLIVKFKNAGVVAWSKTPGIALPPYAPNALPEEPEEVLLTASPLVANTVCFINALDADESRTIYRTFIANSKRKFVDSGFTVTEKIGVDADVAFYRQGWKGFGAIVLYAHGFYQPDNGTTWVTTGEIGTLQDVVRDYPNEWSANQISSVKVSETRGGMKREVPYYMVSNKLFEAAYSPTDFPGSIIYLGVCSGMEDPQRSFAQMFVNKGVAAVVGWTKPNSIGPATGELLFKFLLCGKKLADVLRALPRESKTDNHASAILSSHPEAANDFRLVTPERKTTLVLDRPLADSTYTTRNLWLEGRLTSGDSLSNGIVQLNGVATRLTIASDLRSFSQAIVLKSGRNRIQITALLKPNGGGCACVDTTYEFNGNFAPLDLWTELRWTTPRADVDFHLLPPGAAFPGDFWTPVDCYYSNRMPAWGASLDVDDIDGIGPEHITLPTVTMPGTYRLFAHYYSAHGDGATTAYASVSVRNGPNSEFGPKSLSSYASRGGHVWEICTIKFPEGTVVAVGQVHALPETGTRADKQALASKE